MKQIKLDQTVIIRDHATIDYKNCVGTVIEIKDDLASVSFKKRGTQWAKLEDLILYFGIQRHVKVVEEYSRSYLSFASPLSTTMEIKLKEDYVELLCFENMERPNQLTVGLEVEEAIILRDALNKFLENK